MSVIKDLKSKFSSIAWCPEKEHASVMAVATMKDLTPVESESPKSLSLYDWRLDNVAESQMVAEESLPAGICCFNWSCIPLPDRENIKSLIALGMSDGSVDFWLPSFTQENGWSLEHVCFGIDDFMNRYPRFRFLLRPSSRSVQTAITMAPSFVLVALMEMCSFLIYPT